MEINQVVELENLPPYAQAEVLYKLDYESLRNLCMSSATIFRSVCNKNWFWMNKFKQDFGEEYLDDPYVLNFKDNWKARYEIMHLSKALDIPVRFLNRKWAIDFYENAPESIGVLVYAKNLALINFYNVSKIPDSIGNLTNLKYLSISSDNLTSLPDTIGNLSNLKYLDLEECPNLEKLPESIGDLYNLKRFYRNNAPLPETIGKISSDIFNHRRIGYRDRDLWISYRRQYLLANPESVCNSVTDHLIKIGLGAHLSHSLLSLKYIKSELDDQEVNLFDDTWQFQYFMWVKKAPSRMAPSEYALNQLKTSFISEAAFKSTLRNLPLIIEKLETHSTFRTKSEFENFLDKIIPYKMDRALGWHKRELIKAIHRSDLPVNISQKIGWDQDVYFYRFNQSLGNRIQSRQQWNALTPEAKQTYQLGSIFDNDLIGYRHRLNKKALLTLYLIIKYRQDNRFRELVAQMSV